MAEVIEVEIEQASEQEQRGREDEYYGGTYIFKLLDHYYVINNMPSCTQNFV